MEWFGNIRVLVCGRDGGEASDVTYGVSGRGCS